MAKRKKIIRKSSKKSKKRMTPEQEFEIMKMVLDKFLWLGFIIMAFGLYMMIRAPELMYKGFTLIIAGGIVLILLTILIVKEFEIIEWGRK
ncbi:hypothetical protein COV16_05650 [Candidatus Woesearchaeota archaeon CG10_big_fil_rev_8_21_14_0_10_34_8]|nr:MAG: hypothetical protein COV16_05650 [Candidatus Woesearchaeota archaeon CG10_big_fil_rev_8_21_14_0_10_34_8]